MFGSTTIVLKTPRQVELQFEMSQSYSMTSWCLMVMTCELTSNDSKLQILMLAVWTNQDRKTMHSDPVLSSISPIHRLLPLSKCGLGIHFAINFDDFHLANSTIQVPILNKIARKQPQHVPCFHWKISRLARWGKDLEAFTGLDRILLTRLQDFARFIARLPPDCHVESWRKNKCKKKMPES